MEYHNPYPPPSPSETPFRTPSSALSHRSREYDMSPSSTPPPLPSDVRILKKRSNDSQTAFDESISPLDPRRFTPTLHASLVSEILSLRRDLENKTKNIDLLENSLHTAQAQNEGLSKSLLASNKEIRSTKRQMQLLEGGTLSALNELSTERDDALQDAAELRRRLDHAQRRAKSHEDNADRTQALWDKDKELWATEKRTLETKSQIAEGRLKTVLDEVIHSQAHAQSRDESRSTIPVDIDRVSEIGTSGPSSPVAFSSPTFRNRRQSVTSILSERFGGRTSALSFVNEYGTNLADELALDDIEEASVEEPELDNGRFSPDALVEERVRPASNLSRKARKVLGLAFDIEDLEVQDRSQNLPQSTPLRRLPPTTVSYIDSAVQYSPPSSTEHNLRRRSDELTTVILEAPKMVSSACQTVEYLLSPPPTPKQDDTLLETIHESTLEKAEMKDMSTQTDVRPRPGGSSYIHSRTSTHDLGIPLITIFPPTSRPTTPETTVVLPPQTRNAACQVESKMLFNYTDSVMQTEEIKIDMRRVLWSRPIPADSNHTSLDATKSKEKYDKLRRASIQLIEPVTSLSKKRTNVQIGPHSFVNDDGPLAAESSLASSRPVRSSSLFAGFDDYAEELDDEIDQDIFYEDEFTSRPTAKFTLRSGKLISQENVLEDIGELTAVSAGEAIALDNLRKSETRLPQELRQLDTSERTKDYMRQNTIRRGGSGSKQPNVRRSVLIQSGVATHRSRNSQSTVDTSSVEGSNPPPMPIPLRYSSARIGKANSDSGRNSRGSSNNTSPTRQHRHKYKPALRKARSGPAISPTGHSRRARSRTPPLDSRVSIVPEMPHFEMPGQTPYETQMPLTNDLLNAPHESVAPRPSVATGPGRSYNHLKQASDPVILPQTTVVDAIAQTMVGEWMYKYVRRRKSFGKPDKDWDPNKSVEELVSNPTSAGVRHKRWVWLAPYERAVMWSSKQPMNGTALLGKSGRKLTVKSVLDVKDDNIMPKNSLTGPAFNRSILILTPQRALKFTATSQERHFVWLTALSFLSHSPLSIGDLAALPPAPDDFRMSSTTPVQAGGSFRRRTLRDSIRIAKGSSKRDSGRRSLHDGSTANENFASTRPSTQEFYNREPDTALPPIVSRFHNRNRSNTAPRPLASSYTSFSQRDVFTSSASNYNNNHNEAGPSDRTQFSRSTADPSFPGTRRGSEASVFGRPTFNQNSTQHIQPSGFSFADSSHNASMTMRMDAFIDTKQIANRNPRQLRLGGSSRATNKDLSYWGLDENASMTSPVDSLAPGNSYSRQSDNTRRESADREFFRGL